MKENKGVELFLAILAAINKDTLVLSSDGLQRYQYGLQVVKFL